MKNKYFKILLIILCCFIVSGCSNIKAIRNKKLNKKEVIKLVEDKLNEKYDDLNIELTSVENAYTAEEELIKNGKSYYFEIKDKNGNKAYANYRDAFRIEKEIFDASFIESYGAIYNNNELEYYEHLAQKYISKEDIKEVYYAADYKEVDYVTKAKVVYELNYKIKDMSLENYFNLLMLGFDIQKYRLEQYGTINYDDPEIYLLFKGSDKYYYVSYYGLVEEGAGQYDVKIKLDDYTDNYNLRKYINFNINDDEYNKMISKFNSIGKYILNNVSSINVKNDNNNGYVLINNYTKNDYLMSLLIKFNYDSNSDSYKYQNMSIIDNNSIGNFDGFVVKSW